MRKILLAVLLIFALSLGSVAMAQDTECLGLPAAECALLEESNAAMAGITSAAFDFSLAISDGGAPMPMLSGSGRFNGEGISVDPMALTETSDPAAIIGALSGVIPMLNAELNLDLSGAGMPLQLNLLLVDGVGYLNFGALSMLLGGSEALTQMGLPTEWGGLDLVDTLTNLAPMMEGMSGEMGDMGATEMDPAQAEALGENMLQYVTAAAVAGTGTTDFVYTVDLAGILSDPAFAEMVTEQIEAQGMSQAEAEEALGALQNGSASLTMTVNNDSKFIERLFVSLVFTVEGETAGIEFTTNVSGHNATAPVAAPAGAPVAKFMDLMMLMQGSF
jgi:hypothetical protein